MGIEKLWRKWEEGARLELYVEGLPIETEHGEMFEDMDDAELMDALADVDSGLKSRELDFVEDNCRRLAGLRKHGREGDFRLSEKQRSWAEDIWERVR